MVYTMLISDWMGQTNKLYAVFRRLITLSFQKELRLWETAAGPKPG